MPWRGLPVLALLALPPEALALCIEVVGYDVARDGTAVVVQPTNFQHRGCGGADALLRQEVATGATVRLADFCKPLTNPLDPKPYLDECVPAGTYRYGFEVPYACASSGCATERWQVFTVAAEPVGCTRSDGNPGPVSVGPVGWAAGTEHVCEAYAPDDGGLPQGCSTAAGGSGAWLVLAAVALLHRRRRRAVPSRLPPTAGSARRPGRTANHP